MFNKNKTPSPAKARELSKKGYDCKTQATIKGCINDLNNHIEFAASNGHYKIETWFHNNSGYLTPPVMNKIIKHFQELGYMANFKEEEKIGEHDRESYFITLDWLE